MSDSASAPAPAPAVATDSAKRLSQFKLASLAIGQKRPFNQSSIYQRIRSLDRGLFGQESFSDDIFKIVNNSKKFMVQVDVEEYLPEEIKVTQNDREVTVSANKEISDECGFMSRSFTRKIKLPETVDLASLRTTLTVENFLKIEATKVQEEDKGEGNVLTIYDESGHALN
ncbi:unnamed protein product [Caenorhabditis auriculariae]|uniref:SHSP domain-containing protein n=1 Tax=Caenorhabditis auriculariae TaxID=2777116 RepID=A0A8S1HQY9_9PELO|nr:unnamed protein product [Caenorhabditis auriculariae]